MVTINDVAKLAGVSKSTVSRVLVNKIPVSRETKERVLKAIKEINYQPNMLAKGLKEGKTFTIGLIIPNITNPFYPAIARGIEDLANEKRYSVVLCDTDENEDKELDYVKGLRNRIVDGLIICPASKSGKCIKELKADNFPVVLLARRIPGVEADTILVQDFNGAYDMTNYLIHRGHRKIAIINGDTEIDNYKQRFEGYKAALADNDIPINNEFILNTDSSISMQESYDLINKLLSSGNIPTAVFATSDPKAIGAMKAIADRGYNVPGDISVVGFDNIEMAQFMTPSLTSYDQPTYRMGAMACERLLKLINSKRALKPNLTYIDGKIIERNSVAKIST
jgi:LacI family transcriptional regulator